MINSITFSKKTMATHGTLVISIPPEIIEDMELVGNEMVEVWLTKKPHVQKTIVSCDAKVCVPTDMGIRVMHEFRMGD